MPSLKPSSETASRTFQIAAVLVIIFALLIFLLPADSYTQEKYNLSPLGYDTLRFTIAIPAILTWVAAFFAYTKLREYAAFIRKTTESEHFSQISKGVGILAWSLPIIAIITVLMSGIANTQANFRPSAIITMNYLNLLLPLIAFSVIGIAVRGLVSDAKLKLSFSSMRVIMILFLAAGVIYCFLTFQQLDLTSLASSNNPYFIPIWLLVLTIIIPALYAWFVGLLAAYEITLYSKKAQGVLYRHALRWLSAGLVTVIASLIALQYMNTVQPRVGHLEFNQQLMFNVIFRIVGGIGFVLITIGAIKLKRIEEV